MSRYGKKDLNDKMSLGKGPDEIDLFYFGLGHHNGDAWVVFPALRSCTPATSFRKKTFRSWTRRMAAAALPSGFAMKAFDTVKNVDTIITGHSPAHGRRTT